MTTEAASPTTWRLVGSSAMRALDRYTIDNLGVPGELLMESAGRAVADTVWLQWRELPDSSNAEILVVCGPGSNGGDGFVAARHLHMRGLPVRLALVAAGEGIGGDAANNRDRAMALKITVEGPDWEAPACGVIVDALLGTGLSRPVTGALHSSIERINARRRDGSGVRVVSVDMPSGVCSDTGQVMGAAVAADVTLTVELPKLGMALEPGRSLAGSRVVAHVGIATRAPGVSADAELWTHAEAGRRLPTRPIDGHKGTFGHALIVGGSRGMSGAVTLAARAAGRVGAGLVSIACPAGIHEVVALQSVEAMTEPLPDTESHGLSMDAGETIIALAGKRDAVGLGPGLGRQTPSQELVRLLTRELDLPLVIDADALRALAGYVKHLEGRRNPTVLTPHPGEAGELLGVGASDVNADRIGAARRLARDSGCVVLLKGAGTVVAAADGRLAINATGGPALATGGTGDVLLGMVTGLLAQGTESFEAATLAAHWHGAAGDGIESRGGSAGLLAGDLVRELPDTERFLRDAARTNLKTAVAETVLAANFPGP
ncbi:NAD(P)H-hydrate dehydratase [Myxococcota bacterium]|nr:NAD(P)H-hydrate dehydratase [Myxococcota bacterium]